MENRFLKINDVRALNGISQSLTYRYVSEGKFPPPIKIGNNSVWDETAVRKWMDDRRAGVPLPDSETKRYDQTGEIVPMTEAA